MLGRQFAKLARTLIAAALVVLLVRTLVVEGLVTPLVVDGSSMAPKLLGPHVDIICPRCGEKATVGLDQLPEEEAFDCPACGKATLSIKGGALEPGDRLVVNRLARPRRWDLAVAYRPEEATRLAVKRVLGLPGESVTLDAGDLVINGDRVAKNLDQQRRLRIPVHNETTANHRWRAVNGDWRFQENAWRANPIANEPAKLACQQPGYVTDGLAHNQRVSRRLNRVGDLMLTCQLTLAADARCRFAIVFGGKTISANLDGANSRAELSLSGLEPSTAPLPDALRRGAEVTLSTFDRQAVLAVGDETLFDIPLQQAFAASLLARPAEFFITASGGVATVRDLRLWRDVYYETRPADARPPWRLGPDEWLLVGDNQAISLDSRNRGVGVPERLMLGRVVGAR